MTVNRLRQFVPGIRVAALRDGNCDPEGLPIMRPRKGKVYILESVYGMAYGAGCTLVGMDHFPYKGYCLWVKPGHRVFEAGWYFEPLIEADEEFTKLIRKELTT